VGKYETESRNKRRYKDLRKLILKTVATTGLVGVSFLAPNVIGAMGRMGMIPSKRQKDTIRVSRERLIKKGMLKYSRGGLCITKKGEIALQMAEVSDHVTRKPKRWDGRWRVLMFDIPEKKKNIRERVRQKLRSVGFVYLQDSVWLYPYDCEDLITLLKSELHIGKEMLYMIVDFLEYDAQYRKHFGLSKK
jgi:hypothetical protein|tara:strand:- start:62 stop:634 length:573 start_codon:yes stop_codon:yes gene_type:complete